MFEQKRQLAELLKNFSYQAPTSPRSNTSISPLRLSKNPSSNGSVRETEADMDASFYPSPVDWQTLHRPLKIDMFTHKDAGKLVEWIDKKKNPPSARAAAQRYQVYLNQELSEVESSPLGSMSASGSAPKTCANNDNIVLEDARLDQLYCGGNGSPRSSTASTPFPAILPCSNFIHDGVDELGHQTDIFNLIPAPTLVIEHRQEELQFMADRLEKAITKLPAPTENGAVFPFAARFGYAEWTKARDPYYLYPYEKALEVCIFVKSNSPSNADLDMNTTTNTTMNTIVKDSHHDMSIKYNLSPCETSNHNAKQPEQGQGEYICTSMERVRTATMARRPIPKTTTEAVLMLNIIILFYSTWYGLDPDGMPHMISTSKDRVRKVVLETLIETLYHEAYE
ncbi:hypothetical protein IAS59_006329 [Cryptococcus gattii]